MRPDIFRKDAIEHNSRSTATGILIATNVGMVWTSALIFVVFTAFLAFITLASYTDRVTVKGLVSSNSGLVKLRAPMAGVIEKKFADEAQFVRKGAVLYEISSDRLNQRQNNIQLFASEKIRERLLSHERDLHRIMSVHKFARIDLERRSDELEEAVATIEQQTLLQQDRLKLAQESTRRFRELSAQKFISPEQLQQKLIDELENSSKVRSLQKERAAALRSLASIKGQLEAMPYEQSNEISQFQRSYSSAQQELAESEARRKSIVTAPNSGKIASINYMEGQIVQAQDIIATLIPEGYRPQVELYIPSRAVGFVRKGGKVALRLQAFPYQRFGQINGEVSTIGSAPLQPAEIASLGVPVSVTSGEAVYRAIVTIKGTPTIPVASLVVGMQLEGDILQDEKKLYQWILSPLLAITSKF